MLLPPIGHMASNCCRLHLKRVISVSVILKGQEYNSFEELKADIDDLKNVFHNPLRIFDSQTVQDVNRRCKKSNSLLGPIDEKWWYTYISYRYELLFNSYTRLCFCHVTVSC